MRPTILSLVGLEDSYTHDGRVLTEALEGHDPWGTPPPARRPLQADAPFGGLAMSSLKVSAAALTSNTPGDAMYTALQNKIADWTARRAALAADIRKLLHGAAGADDDVDEDSGGRLIMRAEALLADARRCADDPVSCSH